ncbi:MAG TPA: histidine--tRNA ligase [Syntrophales bacterium]|nr:histidine--tRNA ligase [Syntrophales bacterium]HRS86488.1 histidine--tRNA ligase [Syntrophales bacterium]HRV42099.1 histidine--tRNA ligase [Syntrophales bacterium]
MEAIGAVKGFKDILPDETPRWRQVEERARRVFSSFGFREIRVPLLERTELFRRGIGEATDIVEKEMYTFLDRGDEYLTLRPEATASIMRAYIEHHLYAAEPVAKLYTIGPMFRRERPQKGRFRQFHQIDVEILGLDDPRVDAELILMLAHFLREVRIEDYEIEVNSLGCPRCRPSFRAAVVAHLKGREGDLCPDCRRRLDTNPLRTFDCKVPGCGEIVADAPLIPDYLCPDCKRHFDDFCRYLELFSLRHRLNPKMVRGLDYYTKTAFEVTTTLLGAQNAVAGGGRYDGLIRTLGGPDVPGIGFAVGMERLLSLMPPDGAGEEPFVFLAALGERAQETAYLICNRLRLRGVWAETDYSGKGLKAQLKRADKLGCPFAVILGDRELDEGRAIWRDMEGGDQRQIDLKTLDDFIFATYTERSK